MLIQRRQPFKRGWSNLWDITVGGNAIAGDSSRSAAERETRAELGLSLDQSAWKNASSPGERSKKKKPWFLKAFLRWRPVPIPNQCPHRWKRLRRIEKINTPISILQKSTLLRTCPDWTGLLSGPVPGTGRDAPVTRKPGFPGNPQHCLSLSEDPMLPFPMPARYMRCRNASCSHFIFRFSFAMEARVGIFMGQTSMQDSDLEQVFPKCST